jgi:hypothetical protein
MHHPRQQLHLSPHAIQPSKAAQQQLTWQHTFISHADVSAHIRLQLSPRPGQQLFLKTCTSAFPKNLHSSFSQKLAQQHFSSPQAAAHVIFKGWTAASSLSLCAGQQQFKDQNSMGIKVPHAQASPAARPRQQQLPSRLQHLTAWTAAFLFSPTSNTCSSSPIPTAHVKSHLSCIGSNVLEHKNTNTSLEF